MKNIYVIQVIGSNFYKVGVGSNVKVKEVIDAMNQLNPFGAEIYYSVPQSNAEQTLESLRNSILYHQDDWFIVDSDEKKKILDSFLIKERLEINNKFWSLVADGELNVLNFNHKRTYSKQTPAFEAAVLEWIAENYKGKMMLSNTEIYHDLIEASVVPVEFSQRDLGRILRPRFKQKLISIDGKKKRVYIFDE